MAKPVYQLTQRQVLNSFDDIPKELKTAAYDASVLTAIIKRSIPSRDVGINFDAPSVSALGRYSDSVLAILSDAVKNGVTQETEAAAKAALTEKMDFLDKNPIKPTPFKKEVSPKSTEFLTEYLDKNGLSQKGMSPATKRRLASSYQREDNNHKYNLITSMSLIDTPVSGDVFNDYLDKVTASKNNVFPQKEFEDLGDNLLPMIKQKGQIIVNKTMQARLVDVLSVEDYRRVKLHDKSDLFNDERTTFADVINKKILDEKYYQSPLAFGLVMYAYIESLNKEIDLKVKRGGTINVAMGSDIDTNVNSGLKDALRFVPSDWIEQSNNIGALYVAKSKDENADKKDRAFMGFITKKGQYSTNTYNMLGGDGLLGAPSSKRTDYSETMHHELMHRFQSVLPEIDSVFQAEHRRRTKGIEKNRILGGNSSELGIEDDYPLHYYGKEYDNKDMHTGAQEVMAMALTVLTKGQLTKTKKNVYIGCETVSFLTDELLAISLGVLTEFKAG